MLNFFNIPKQNRKFYLFVIIGIIAITVVTLVGVFFKSQQKVVQVDPHLEGKAPFSVCVDDSSKARRDMVKTANSMIGIDGFLEVVDTPPCDIVVCDTQEQLEGTYACGRELPSEVLDPNFNMVALLGVTQNQCLIVDFERSGLYAVELMSLIHEIGHCFGLPHDNVGNSVMNASPARFDDLPTPRFLDGHRKILRSYVD